MLERFSDRAREVITLAQEQARAIDHGYVGTEHLLLGLLCQERGGVADLITAAGAQLDAARDQVLALVGRGEQPPRGHVPFTPRCRRVLGLALQAALERQQGRIEPGHLLLGLLREGEGVAVQVLLQLGVDLTVLAGEVARRVGGQPRAPLVGSPPRLGPSGTRAVAATAREAGGDVPRCPYCSAVLGDDALGARVVGVAEGGEDDTVRLVFCRRCGASLGVLPS